MSIELRVIDYMKGWLAGCKAGAKDGGKRARHFCGVDYESGYDSGRAAYIAASKAKWEQLVNERDGCSFCGGRGRMPPEGFLCPECHGTGRRP